MVTRGNLLLAVLILSVVAVLWSLFFKSVGESISLKDFVGMLPTVITLLGIDKETKKSRSIRQRDAKPFRLSPSFDSGIYGGLIGGALAGLIIGVMYYLTAQNRDPLKYGLAIERPSWNIIPQIFLYASFGGILLGAMIQLLILYFRHLARARQYPAFIFNEVSGGILGGALAGIPAGALGGWFFGLMPIPFPPIALLVTGSGLGAICIVLGVLLYDYEGRWRNIIRAFLVSMVISVFAAILSLMTLSLLQIEHFFPWGATALLVAQGGAIIGGVIGAVLGLQVGLTLRLYRFWEVATK